MVKEIKLRICVKGKGLFNSKFRIHRHLLNDFKYAVVWGTSVKFNPQKVGKDHPLNDEDVV